jgi:thiamine biosynthesis lipoprotein
MGTRFELAIVAEATADVRKAPASAWAVDVKAVGELALREIEEWHRRLTRFEPDSWLTHLNRTAAHEPVRVDDELFPLFADAIGVWRDSGGAFDIARGDGAAVMLDEAAHTLQFSHQHVALDLGAIAKGHALDCAAARLKAHGVTQAWLQGGTSSGVAIGLPPDAGAWRIGVSSLAGAGVDEVIDLVDESFSLSDEASQPDAPLGRHIVDPRLAPGTAPTRASRRVIVTGPSARVADAWSTALAVLGVVPPAFPAAYTARFLRQ